MLKNYFKVALRQLIRNKIYSFINLLGLSVGIASVIILFLYIRYELSFDDYHEKKDRIYRIQTRYNDHVTLASASYLLAGVLKNEAPEVETTVRVFDQGNTKIIDAARRKEEVEARVLYVDSTFFQVFTYRFLEGNTKALYEAETAVLTRATAIQLFGSIQRAMYQPILVSGKFKATVKGVIEDIPDNSHFKFGILVSMNALKEFWFEWIKKSWQASGVINYALLKKGADRNVLEKKLLLLPAKYIENEKKQSKRKIVGFEVFPLLKIHLYSNFEDELDPNGDIRFVYMLSSIALLILLIACFNYINLATARATTRAKEVGVRKVVGSQRWQLMGQFISESMLMVFLSFTLGLCLVEILLPLFNQIDQQHLFIPYSNLGIAFFFLALILLIGLLGGAYPAFILSAFQPVLVLKGKFSRQTKGVWLRRSIVVFQFMVSIVMIISTLVIYRQMQYIRHKNLGFNQDNIAVLNFFSVYDRWDHFRKRLLLHPAVIEVGKASASPGISIYEGLFLVENRAKMEKYTFKKLATDENLLKLMEIKLLSGRYFSNNREMESGKSVIVNEAFVKQMNWKIDSTDPMLNPIGKKIHYEFDSTGKAQSLSKIIGVVKDFHQSSLREKISPLVITLDTGEAWRTYVKMRSAGVQATLAFIQKTWEEVNTEDSFEYTMMSQVYFRQYENDRRKGEIYLIFSILAIFIACLGLFGLASFTVEQKKKEIGIRKVLGASLNHIFSLVVGDFVRLVLIAFAIALPVSFYLMLQYLQDFVYKIHLLSNWFSFLLAGFLALGIALLTIGSQAIQAGNMNPIKVLKEE